MHYNIQINVQQVGEKEVPSQRRGVTIQNASTRKTVVDVLSLKVVATSEKDAYAKAAQMLAAATPEFAMGPIPSGYDPDEEDGDGF